VARRIGTRSVAVTVYMPKEIYEELKKIARKRDTSVSSLIREAAKKIIEEAKISGERSNR